MKKILSLLAAAAMSLSLTACSGNDNSEPLPTVSAEITGEQLTGIYKASNQMSDLICEFRSNNTVRYTVTFNKQPEHLEGSYVFDGKTLILKNAEGEEIECEYNKEDDTFNLEGVLLMKEKPAEATAQNGILP